jgi:hypothetical protein
MHLPLESQSEADDHHSMADTLCTRSHHFRVAMPRMEAVSVLIDNDASKDFDSEVEMSCQRLSKSAFHLA